VAIQRDLRAFCARRAQVVSSHFGFVLFKTNSIGKRLRQTLPRRLPESMVVESDALGSFYAHARRVEAYAEQLFILVSRNKACIASAIRSWLLVVVVDFVQPAGPRSRHR